MAPTTAADNIIQKSKDGILLALGALYWYAGSLLRLSLLTLPHGRAPRTHSPPMAAAAVARARFGRRAVAPVALGGLSLPSEAVEALEAAACVARDDGGGDALGPVGHPLGDALGPVGHPLGGAAVLVRGAVAATARGALLEGVQELGGVGGVAAEVVHEVEGDGVVLDADVVVVCAGLRLDAADALGAVPGTQRRSPGRAATPLTLRRRLSSWGKAWVVQASPRASNALWAVSE